MMDIGHDFCCNYCDFYILYDRMLCWVIASLEYSKMSMNIQEMCEYSATEQN
jgi:hypothetical protein